MLNKQQCLRLTERPQLKTHRRLSWKSVTEAQTQQMGGRNDEYREIKTGCAKDQRPWPFELMNTVHTAASFKVSGQCRGKGTEGGGRRGRKGSLGKGSAKEKCYEGFCKPCYKFGMFTEDNEKALRCLSRGSDIISHMILEDNSSPVCQYRKGFLKKAKQEEI